MLISIGALLSTMCLRRRRRSAATGGRTVPLNVALFAAFTGPMLLNLRPAPALGVDCNANSTNDECDINCAWPRCGAEPCGDVEDCNRNRIPDSCELPECQLVEVVFLMDLSPSVGQQDRPTPDDLCDQIDLALDALNDPPAIPFTAEVVAIGAPNLQQGERLCECCCDDLAGCSGNEDTVPGVYASRTCGLPEALGDCAGSADVDHGTVEDWGPATAVGAKTEKWGAIG